MQWYSQFLSDGDGHQYTNSICINQRLQLTSIASYRPFSDPLGGLDVIVQGLGKVSGITSCPGGSAPEQHPSAFERENLFIKNTRESTAPGHLSKPMSTASRNNITDTVGIANSSPQGPRTRSSHVPHTMIIVGTENRDDHIGAEK